MVLSPIEIIALVFIVLGLVKIVFVLFSARTWLDLVKRLYSNATVLIIIELVLAAIVLYYLLDSGLTIIQIISCVVLGALLTGMTFAVYAKEMLGLVSKMLSKDALKRAWLPIIVWLAIIVWGLIELFG